jgi:hypothetical protein
MFDSVVVDALEAEKGSVIEIHTKRFRLCLSESHGRHGFEPEPCAAVSLTLIDIREAGRTVELVGTTEDGDHRAVPFVSTISCPEGFAVTAITTIIGRTVLLQPRVQYSELDGRLVVGN